MNHFRCATLLSAQRIGTDRFPSARVAALGPKQPPALPWVRVGYEAGHICLNLQKFNTASTTHKLHSVCFSTAINTPDVSRGATPEHGRARPGRRRRAGAHEEPARPGLLLPPHARGRARAAHPLPAAGTVLRKHGLFKLWRARPSAAAGLSESGSPRCPARVLSGLSESQTRMQGWGSRRRRRRPDRAGPESRPCHPQLFLWRLKRRAGPGDSEAGLAAASGPGGTGSGPEPHRRPGVIRGGGVRPALRARPGRAAIPRGEEGGVRTRRRRRRRG